MTLSPDVDAPAELDTNSLSISDATPFAFYCLFLSAFFFSANFAAHLGNDFLLVWTEQTRHLPWGTDKRELAGLCSCADLIMGALMELLSLRDAPSMASQTEMPTRVLSKI